MTVELISEQPGQSRYMAWASIERRFNVAQGGGTIPRVAAVPDILFYTVESGRVEVSVAEEDGSKVSIGPLTPVTSFNPYSIQAVELSGDGVVNVIGIYYPYHLRRTLCEAVYTVPQMARRNMAAEMMQTEWIAEPIAAYAQVSPGWSREAPLYSIPNFPNLWPEGQTRLLTPSRRAS
jgi:hypothetical protein